MIALKSKTKWTRVGGPKVRTGCVTCKARHLKCDEGKPNCERCIRTGFKCEGYPTIRRRRRVVRSKVATLHSDSQLAPNYMTKISHWLLYVGTISEADQCPLEADFFHHVRTCLAQDFTTALTTTDFWSVYALPLGHTVKPVRAALCALGSAHKLFKIQFSAPGPSAASALEEFSIQQYNLAINHINTIDLGGGSELDVVLICCVIFICIENLLGRYAESLKHLKAAYALLGSQSQSLQATGEKFPTAVTRCRLMFLSSVHQILSSLGQDIAIYTGHGAIPELSLYSTYNLLVEDSSLAFDSLGTAIKSLRNFEVQLATGFTLCPQDATDSLESILDGHLGQPRLLFNRSTNEAQEIVSVFNIWSTRFDAFKDKADFKSFSEKERYQLQAISLVQAIHSTFVATRPTKGHISTNSYSKLLQLIEGLIDSHGFRKTPTFSFDATIIPILSIICTSCDDINIQKRAVEVLRSVKRREGIWNSQEVADVLESFIEAQDEGLVFRDSTPWHLFRIVEMLHSGAMSGCKTAVGLVELAERV